MRSPHRAGAALAALTVAVGLLTGCTRNAELSVFQDPVVPVGAMKLVAFTSCDDLLEKLRAAAKESVGPLGFGGPRLFAGDDTTGGGARRATALDGRAAPESATEKSLAAPPAGDTDPGQGRTAPDHSGTNTHESGVDEPDLIKTDGRRIVTLSQGVLRVIDPASRRITGRLDLATAIGPDRPMIAGEADLLLSGDRALLLLPQHFRAMDRGVVPPPDQPRGKPIIPQGPDPDEIVGPLLVLVDLTGTPRVAASYRVDGALVDARQVGATARIVVRSAPRLVFPYQKNATDAQRAAAADAVIDRSGADDWLPRYEVTTGGQTTRGRVGCESVSRPARYSGTSLVTVLSFDLGAGPLGTGDPVTVVADGDTVYSNGTSLYVANNQGWRVAGPRPGRAAERTEIYRFDTAQPGPPRYAAAGSVPGRLLNQYAISEWDGHLRVATTTDGTIRRDVVRDGRPRPRPAESAVYVLAQDGGSLTTVGKVGGLGKGERIYSVRFVGTVGYVVTFRQTDPLYTVDLSRPTEPRVMGELKINGYSAYLHPVDSTRLLGVGQDATAQGQVRGTQVSLFDVADLARPDRIAQHHVRYGSSEAEFDPHAFLYWPADGTLVLPLTTYPRERGIRATPTTGALVLRVTPTGFTEVGTVTHETRGQAPRYSTAIRRSLVIGAELWTVSDAGLKSVALSNLDERAWIPFT